MENQSGSRTGIEDVAASILRNWWFLGLVSIVIMGLLVLATLPWPSNRFALKVVTHVFEVSASASATHSISVSLPNPSEIEVLNADGSDLPPELAALGGSPVSVRLALSSATLQSISLPSGARFIVAATSSGKTDIGVLNGGSIRIALSGPIDRMTDTGQREPLTRVQRATAWDITAAGIHNPARLSLRADIAPIALYNQPISEFRFSPPRPTVNEPATFQSEILDGELQLLDTGTTIKLTPRELVLLEGGRWFLSRVEVANKVITVDVLGEARRISVGPPRPGSSFTLDRDLTPTILSYLVGQHQLKLLWGVALAVLTTLWKGRQWALNWRRS